MEGSLSRRERQVADLVAEGLTNREIAERLVVSERTAEGHVEQIRNKLGFHSRSQIAAWVASRPRPAATMQIADTADTLVAMPRRILIPTLPRVSRKAIGIALVVVVTVVATIFWPRQAPARLALVAGVGSDGFSGDRGPAVAAQLSEITSLAFDRDGALLMADSGPDGFGGRRTRIRRVDTSGGIKTVAGDGAVLRAIDVAESGSTLDIPSDAYIAVGKQGEIYVAAGSASSFSVSTHWIGRIDPDDRFTWIAGGWIDVHGGGPVGTRRTDLRLPHGIAIASDGTIYVADSRNNRILAIPPEGEVVTVAGSAERVSGGGGDGGPARAASLFQPLAVALSPDGTLYIADTNNHRVRAIDHGGTIATVVGDGTQTYAGDGGAATRASLALPSSLVFGRDGVLYIADTGNARVRAVAKDGAITTVAGPPDLMRPTAVAVDAAGVLYIADSGAHRIYKLVR